LRLNLLFPRVAVADSINGTMILLTRNQSMWAVRSG